MLAEALKEVVERTSSVSRVDVSFVQNGTANGARSTTVAAR